MIAVRIAPDMPFSVVGSPSYFQRCPPPETPQDLLRGHRCINLRRPSSGGFYVWNFVKDDRPVKVHTVGAFVFNALDLMLDAAKEGLSLTYLPKVLTQDDIDQGRLVSVLED